MATEQMLEIVSTKLWNIIRTATGAAANKVYYDRPIGTVTGLPRYSIIGPHSDNLVDEFIGDRYSATKSGTQHELVYDIEVWSKSNLEAVQEMDKIEDYILQNRNDQLASNIEVIEIDGHNYIFEAETKIHRRILTIRLKYLKEWT